MCIGLHVNLHNEINVQKMFVKLTLGIDFTRLCVQSEQLLLYCRHKKWISSTLDAQVKSKIFGGICIVPRKCLFVIRRATEQNSYDFKASFEQKSSAKMLRESTPVFTYLG